MADLRGRSIIGFRAGGGGDPSIFGINPATGESLQPGYSAVSETELNSAAELAADAFEVFGKTSSAARAAFLRKIADKAVFDVRPGLFGKKLVAVVYLRYPSC